MKTMLRSQMKMAIPVTVGIVLLVSIPRTWSQQPGSLDNTFESKINIGDSGFVRGVVPQPDGKLVVFGSFETSLTQDGQSHYYAGLIRLYDDGRVDTTFPNFGERVVTDAAMQPDGKIVVVGGWQFTNAVKHGNISRLNPDGTPDPTFDPGRGFEQHYLGFTNVTVVSYILLQPDGKMLVAGDFVTAAGVNRAGLARLNSDGSLDTTFVPEPNVRYLNRPVLQPDGRIVTATSGRGLARLNPDGSLDSSFISPQVIMPGTVPGPVASLNDGRILCWMYGTKLSLNPIHLIRLNPDGSRDTTFLAVLTGKLVPLIESAIVQEDGKIPISGNFTNVNGWVRNFFARLDSNGAVDTSFDAGTGPRTFSSPAKTRMARDRDGKLLVSGAFTHFDGIPREQIARLYLEPNLILLQSASVLPDHTFQASVTSPAGKVTQIEMSSDLREWTPLSKFTNGNGSIHFIDRRTDFPTRFYRAVMLDNP